MVRDGLRGTAATDVGIADSLTRRGSAVVVALRGGCRRASRRLLVVFIIAVIFGTAAAGTSWLGGSSLVSSRRLGLVRRAHNREDSEQLEARHLRNRRGSRQYWRLRHGSRERRGPDRRPVEASGPKPDRENNDVIVIIVVIIVIVIASASASRRCDRGGSSAVESAHRGDLINGERPGRTTRYSGRGPQRVVNRRC